MSMLAAAAAALTITVRVYDLYGLPPDQRAEALAVATETLAQAEVSATMIDCTRVNGVAPPPCLALLKSGEVVLRFQDRSDRGAHILGTAVVQEGGPNVMASVYVEPAEDRSIKARLPIATLLGRVTAHEIGHLLLGTNSHAPRGLMRAAWNLKEVHQSEWQFTRADAEKMRSLRLAHRESVAATADE
jgi:hypothetical protein